MKFLVTAALLPLFALTAPAQTKEPVASRTLLVEESGAQQVVWILAATKTSIRYKETEAATVTKDAKIRDFKSIYLFEPPVFSEAKDLYQGRKYEEAKEKFAEIKEAYAAVRALRDNPSTLAAYYEMECMRKLNDLEGLSAALKEFDKTALTREFQLRQLELYVIWDAVRAEAWDRVLSLVDERKQSRLPGFQRVQLSYLRGLALEATGKPDEALTAYAEAMSLDAAASEVIARDAALRSLAILHGREEVQAAIKEAGTEKENKNSRAYGQLLEAASIATLFEKMLGQGVALPEEYKVFLKFQPTLEEMQGAAEKKDDQKAAEEAKEEAAPKKAPRKKAKKK